MAVGAAPEVNTRDLVAIALAGTIGAGLAISMNRWDVDDGYYLNAVVQHLEHPTLAVLSFDGLHGDLTAPIQQVMHRATSSWWLPLPSSRRCTPTACTGFSFPHFSPH
jgi:hypothetical protein